jgi:antitoxin component YwqK of YwqJK toxin-antitoxin module
VSDFDGLDELQASCPPDTHWEGPGDTEGLRLTVNGRVEGRCARPDGTPHGPSAVWYENGAKAAAGDYRDGLKEGPWLFWHENGQLSGQGNFSAGKPDGTWITWHDTGQLESEGFYVDGVQHGRFTNWAPDGQVSQELHYEHGELKTTRQHRSGNNTE